MPLWPRWRVIYRVSQLRSVTDGQASSTFVPHSPQALGSNARICARVARSHPTDEQRKPKVGSVSDPWRAVDARQRSSPRAGSCALTANSVALVGPMREWLEKKYPPLRIRLPSECLAEMGQIAGLSSAED